MPRANTDILLPKDYITTEEGLYFAVVLHEIPGRPVHCSLRYVHTQDCPPSKLDTGRAFEFLRKKHPQFIARSEYLGTDTIMVSHEHIADVYKPGEALERIERSGDHDKLKQTAVDAAKLLVQNGIRHEVIGITGSLMLDFHDSGSDIDIVIYNSDAFRHARDVIRESMNGDDIRPLDEVAWRETHNRRSCALNLDDYKKHEIRKYNKFILHGTKIDISYIPLRDDRTYKPPVEKLGRRTIKGKVVDDTRAFDYPACYIIDNREIAQIQCYTATYTGQAFVGEYIEAAGVLECDREGEQYLVIGTSREASGEYIKVPGL